jgi:PX domain
VTIVACGPCPNTGGNLVYAITVIQPVQSWTVVRSHSDFKNLSDALQQSHVDVSNHVFPDVADDANTSDVDTILNARNDLQEWLSAVLSYPCTYEVLEVGHFLTAHANTIPPQYSNVAWSWVSQYVTPTSQHIDATPQSRSIQSSASQQHHPNQFNRSGNSVNLDDMEMADMFLLTDDDNNPAPLHDDQEYEDDLPPASVRYKPTDEPITDEDEMELMQLADEVEMIDDIGSLAQSLGASHLGRSLQLQASLKHSNYKNNDGGSSIRPTSQHQQQGLNIGGGVVTSPRQQTSPRGGGIGSVMEQAANNNGAHFNHRPPTSAPRLDSFKMIKVIGKGSFGTYERRSCLICIMISYISFNIFNRFVLRH